MHMNKDCVDGVCAPEDETSKGLNPIEKAQSFRIYIPALVSFILLIAGITFRHYKLSFFSSTIEFIWFGIAYLIVGGKVVLKAAKLISKGDVFNEFFLMSIATIGAFVIKEYPEGVAVMLFYNVGELFQEAAVNRAKRSIKALLQIQAEEVTVLSSGKVLVKHPQEVEIGEIIQVKAGEKVPLDGQLLSETASFNTAALTGESVPQSKGKGEIVYAGMINLNFVAEIETTKRFEDTKLSKILSMVLEATTRKAKTQQFITKFAKVYTPIVVALAVLLLIVPYFVTEEYVLRDWVYRALVFLVVSCPCALVISIPLGYFGGIGAASKNGILFKGSNFMDLMREIDTVVMDKTGTMTKGVFKVQQVRLSGFDGEDLIKVVAGIESHSSHPIAKAIVEYAGINANDLKIENVEEIPGHGLKGKVNGYEILAGNAKLLQKFKIPYDQEVDTVIETIVVVAVNNKYAGYITVADEIKEDAFQSITELHDLGIENIVMLSGDKDAITQKVAKQLGIDKAFGGLLPEDKVKSVQALKSKGHKLAFIGDGVNDAPVIALADVGIAMGGIGSDATIETADVVIQTDHPSKIPTSIHISKATHRIVWQNISLAIGVKIIVLALGAGGIATMWEAVFADVGVALLAIVNAVRIQRMPF